jgi:redox-sensitive bicupin YhaK (pirin superfamily)
MNTTGSELELVLAAKDAVLPGGLHVRRAIPQRQRRMVGPFVFIDQMGPALIASDQEITVLPHPHIGLSTVTFLFEGEGLHKDSLGTVQPILPGEVNWMTAGRGIVHSERMRVGASGRLFGVQIWVALPRDQEEAEPSFVHYGTEAVPLIEGDGTSMRVIAGSLHGATSGVKVSSPLFYAEVRMEAGAVFTLAPEYTERSAFVVEGGVELPGAKLAEGEIGFFHPGGEVRLRAQAPTRLLLLGGEPLDGPRYISWNFVSSSKERLEQAADDWREQRFPRVPGETAYIPLPRDGTEPVNYP